MEIKYSDLLLLHPEVFEALVGELAAEWITPAREDELVKFLQNLAESGFGWWDPTDAEIEALNEARAEATERRKLWKTAEALPAAVETLQAMGLRVIAKEKEVLSSKEPATATHGKHNPLFRYALSKYQGEIGNIVTDLIDVDTLYSPLENSIKKKGIRAACDMFRKNGIPALAILEKVDPIGRLIPLLERAIKKEGLIVVINVLFEEGGWGLCWLDDTGSELAAALDRDYHERRSRWSQPINDYLRLFDIKDGVAVDHNTQQPSQRESLWRFMRAPHRRNKFMKLRRLLSSNLVVDGRNIKGMLDFFIGHASSPEARARNGYLTFSSWFMPELAKRPSSMLRYYEAKFPERTKAFASIIGSGDAMCLAKYHAALVADKEYSVLLLGESGTGKELFAEAIHHASGRKGEVRAVNCAAIPHELFEAELFGAVKGAGSNISEREGLFSEANNGTLLLDEIGECHPDHQTKLLRVLQPRRGSQPCQLVIRAVGAGRDKKVNVRVIAGTNRNLLEMVRLNQFRKDLYYRLATVTIKLPPLRDRGESDKRQLADFFWTQINNEFSPGEPNHEAKRLGESAYARLFEHSWPGNVRELEHLLQQVALLTPGSLVVRGNIDAAIAEIPEHSSDGPFRRQREQGFSLPGRLEQIERVFIEDALEACDWVPNRAFKLLGLNSATALRKAIERLEIKLPEGMDKPKRGQSSKSESSPPADHSP